MVTILRLLYTRKTNKSNLKKLIVFLKVTRYDVITIVTNRWQWRPRSLLAMSDRWWVVERRHGYGGIFQHWLPGLVYQWTEQKETSYCKKNIYDICAGSLQKSTSLESWQGSGSRFPGLQFQHDGCLGLNKSNICQHHWNVWKEELCHNRRKANSLTGQPHTKRTPVLKCGQRAKITSRDCLLAGNKAVQKDLYQGHNQHAHSCASAAPRSCSKG